MTTIATDHPNGSSPDHLRAVVADLTDSLVTVRRDLHAHPELAWQEHRTTAVLADLLTGAGIHVRTLPTTGLVAEVGRDAGLGESGTTTVALRADLDALPLDDRTPDPWRATGGRAGARLRSRRARDLSARRRAHPAAAAPPGRPARSGAADLPAGRGGHARRGVRPGRRGRARGRGVDLRPPLRPVARRRHRRPARRPDHLGRGRDHRPPHRARRPHLPPAPDRGPDLRPGQGHHGRAGRAQPAARPAGRSHPGLGFRPVRRRAERHPERR